MFRIISAVSILGFFFLFPTLAHSEEEGARIDLELSGKSFHFRQRADGKKWNEENTGFDLRYVFPPGTLWGKGVEYSLTAGTIKNSEFGQTIFAGGYVRKTVLKIPFGKFSLGLFVGPMNYPGGKDFHERKASYFFPAALPTATLSLGKGAYLNARFIPNVQPQNKNSSGAVLLTVEVPLKHR